jgi:hypothetical protein
MNVCSWTKYIVVGLKPSHTTLIEYSSRISTNQLLKRSGGRCSSIFSFSLHFLNPAHVFMVIGFLFHPLFTITAPQIQPIPGFLNFLLVPLLMGSVLGSSNDRK